MKKLFCLLLLCGNLAFSQDLPSFERSNFVQNGDTLLYRIQWPLHYKPGKQYPLVLMLHGAGERGHDNNAQLVWGADLFANARNRKKFPAIVIFPQCPEKTTWARIERKESSGKSGWSNLLFDSEKPPTPPLSLVMALLDSMLSSGKVDPARVYVGGLSMGGMGTFEILWRKAGLFAAAMPICGGGDPEKVGTYAGKTAVWVFHGDSDPVVPVSNSRTMVDAYKKAGVEHRYTEYPGVQHDSWKNAFGEPELLKWLFRHRKK